MDGLKIVWTTTALMQRNFVLNYWNKRNKSFSYSKKLKIKIKERTKILKVFPETGKQTINKNTRVIFLDNYSIFYKIYLNNIVIVAFWDNRQNPEKLLKTLKEDS